MIYLHLVFFFVLTQSTTEGIRCAGRFKGRGGGKFSRRALNHKNPLKMCRISACFKYEYFRDTYCWLLQTPLFSHIAASDTSLFVHRLAVGGKHGYVVSLKLNKLNEHR